MVRGIKTPPEPARGRVPLAAFKSEENFKALHQHRPSRVRNKRKRTGSRGRPAGPTGATTKGRPRGRLTSGANLSGAFRPSRDPSGNRRADAHTGRTACTRPALQGKTRVLMQAAAPRAVSRGRVRRKPGCLRSRRHPGWTWATRKRAEGGGVA